MFFHILIALGLGVFLGIFTGVTPGIHINLVATVLLMLSPILLQHTTPLVLCAFIIAMAITHTFLDTIPSIFLGAPDSVNALNVLPGHRMLLEGRGIEAVKITILGSYGCLIFAILLIPFLIYFTPVLFAFLKPYIGYILLAVVLFMIFKDRKSWHWNLALFMLSGILGIAVFAIPNFNDPLFPMLSGLFGVSSLILSLSENTKIPLQKLTADDPIPTTTTIKSICAGAACGSLTGIFPGLGASAAAVLASQILGDIGDTGYMILVGGIGTASSLFSLVTLYSIDKARDGSVVVISELITTLPASSFLALVAVALIAGSIAVVITMRLSRAFSVIVSRVNYQHLCVGIILLVTCLVFCFTSLLGLLILATSASIGLIAPLKGVARNQAMGCLILPVIIYYLL